MKVQNSIVSVFKTSVKNKRLSDEIVKEIMLHNQVIACNFDLKDCDKILRIVSKSLISEKVIAYHINRGLVCEELI